MHPAFIHWWRMREGERAQGSEGYAAYAGGCGPRGRHRGFHGYEEGRESAWADDDGVGLGVRRPLRFLAHKLELDDKKVAELARILNELKTERAQAEVDRRRTVSAFADAVSGASFDGGRASEGAKLRVESAERVRDAVLKALEQIHALLDEAQREKLAYLIRTGTLRI
jgi:hypothetical protein